MLTRGRRFFEEMTGESGQADGNVKKGRSAGMIAIRDEALIHRYLYYTMYSKMRMSAIMQHLETEFYLSERRIVDIITANTELARKIKASRPTISQLVKKYPHFSWGTNP